MDTPQWDAGSSSSKVAERLWRCYALSDVLRHSAPPRILSSKAEQFVFVSSGDQRQSAAIFLHAHDIKVANISSNAGLVTILAMRCLRAGSQRGLRCLQVSLVMAPSSLGPPRGSAAEVNFDSREIYDSAAY